MCKFTWIGTVSEHLRLIAVVEEVLHVKHFVVGRDQIFLVDVRAHFDAARLK